MAGWWEQWPFRAPVLIGYHVALMIEIALGLALATVAFNYFVDPKWSSVLLLIDGFVFGGAVIILGIKLLWALAHENGFHVFVTT
jgi:hypothetical protein